jgi:hypothetical protein
MPSARGKIKFLERSIKLKKAIRYENAAAFIDTILTLVSEKPDAFLFTKIEKGGGTITFLAKIVDIKAVVQAESRVEFGQASASVPDTLNSQIRYLARGLIKQLFPTQVVIYRHVGLDAPRFLNYSTISSGVIAAGSAVWYLIEDKNVDDNYERYKENKDVQLVTKFRIATEKSLSRRKIAKNTAIISGAVFGIFLFRDIFFHHNKKVVDEQIDQSMGENTGKAIKLGINHSFPQESISVQLTFCF